MSDMSQPIRTCVGCRAKDARSALIRLVCRDTRVVVDTRGGGPGGGATPPAPLTNSETLIERSSLVPGLA